jgi:hypothetical protein
LNVGEANEGVKNNRLRRNIHVKEMQEALREMQEVTESIVRGK